MTPPADRNLPSISWGLMPATVREHFQRLEWQNEQHLRDRLLGRREVALKLGLKPPTGKQALGNLERLQKFVHSWQRWPEPSQVRFETRHYRELGAIDIPVSFELSSIEALVDFLGKAAKQRSTHWQQVMTPILNQWPQLYPVLVNQLRWLDGLQVADAELVVRLLHQLHAGMGRGLYLRALPLQGVHTKFIELHEPALQALLDGLHENAPGNAGGLRAWLQCTDNPHNWVLVRPLCQKAQQALGCFPLLQLDTATLRSQALPASKILIIENLQSGLGLPTITDTIAVMSGGKNLAWMSENPWLEQREMLYWGDIDSWGMHILSAAREHQPTLQSIMMDHATVKRFEHLMSHEPQSNWAMPGQLTVDEQQLFTDLSQARFSGSRLEQEHLPADFIVDSL